MPKKVRAAMRRWRRCEDECVFDEALARLDVLRRDPPAPARCRCHGRCSPGALAGPKMRTGRRGDPAARSTGAELLDRVADGREDRRDLAAQEDQGDDRDDRDEREDQRVLRETLAFLVAVRKDEMSPDRYAIGGSPPFLEESPAPRELVGPQDPERMRRRPAQSGDATGRSSDRNGRRARRPCQVRRTTAGAAVPHAPPESAKPGPEGPASRLRRGRSLDRVADRAEDRARPGRPGR